MEKITLLPFDLPGKIYRSALPNSSMFDPEHEILPLYQKAGIKWVVALTPDEEALQYTGVHLHNLYRPLGMDVINNPVEDFSAPSFGAFDTAIRLVINNARRSRNIAIHCHAGVGRTGMFVACLARELWGLDAENAIAWVRQYIPKAIDTPYQELFVGEYKKPHEKQHYPQSVKL